MFECIDQCTSGFLDANSSEGTVENYNKVTTKLFPGLRFGCTGKIVRMEVASSKGRKEQQLPIKIQVWRENGTRSDIYYKGGPDIPIAKSVCARSPPSGRIFRCTLKDNFQVSVQRGDILGLELPPSSDIYFSNFTLTEGQTLVNYEFEGQLNSTVDISQAAHRRNGLPQINLLVILGTPLTTSPLC